MSKNLIDDMPDGSIRPKSGQVRCRSAHSMLGQRRNLDIFAHFAGVPLQQSGGATAPSCPRYSANRARAAAAVHTLLADTRGTAQNCLGNLLHQPTIAGK